MLQVKVVRTQEGSKYPLPRYQTALAAGLDLVAAIPQPVSIAPGTRAIVASGLHIELPAGYEAQVRPRSGLAAKKGVTVLNTPGTIDADYRGEILVILINLGQETVTIEPGERIAQLVVAPVIQVHLEEADQTLSATARGESGLGSTGA